MKFSPDKNYQVIPSAIFRCVWMSAGVLSYQLCDREFDCDNCPLDAAMRKHFGDQQSESRHRKSEVRMRTGRELYQSQYLYSRNHCWIHPKPARTSWTTQSCGHRHRIRVGIEPGLAQNLSSPKAVVLPRIGDHVDEQAACLWIVLDGGTFAVDAPVSGTIHKINSRLAEEPHELTIHPLSRGWLYEANVAPDELADAKLLKREDIKEIYSNNSRRFRTLLSEAAMGASVDVGVTLQDGGQAIVDIVSMLGPKRYFQLLREVYG
jgi:glycine cleavage system H lipoate-binding protein